MRTGDPCDKCPDGTLKVYRTVRFKGDDRAIRYLKCDGCGATGRQIISQKKLRLVTSRLVNVDCRPITSPAKMKGRVETFPSSAFEEGNLMTEFLTVRTLAKRLSVDSPTCLRLLRDGSIPPPWLIGGVPRFDVAEIEAWRLAGCPQGISCGGRLLNAVRRAMVDDDSPDATRVGARATAAELSYLLDRASPETLARCEAILSDF